MLLSLAIWIPMVAGVLVLALGERYARWTAWSARCWASGHPSVVLEFDASSSAMQFVEFGRWIERLQRQLPPRVDGISMLFVLLNSFITVLVVIASWSQVDNRVAQYYAAFLHPSGMLNRVRPLDAVCSTFLRGNAGPDVHHHRRVGRPQRVYASVNSFCYTADGLLLMLVACSTVRPSRGRSFAISTGTSCRCRSGVQQLAVLRVPVRLRGQGAEWPVHTWLPDAHTEAPTAGWWCWRRSC